MVASGTSCSENVPLISAAAEEVLPLVRLPKTDVAVISVDFDGVTKKGLQIARSLNTRYPVVRIASLKRLASAVQLRPWPAYFAGPARIPSIVDRSYTVSIHYTSD
jgi:hypothetical protein